MLAVCGLPGASLVTCRVAVRAPRKRGWNLTVTVQLPPAGTLAPVQPSAAIMKSCGLVPARVTVLTTRVTTPVFVTVIGCAAVAGRGRAFPKSMAGGVKDAIGTAPTPDMATAWGLPAAFAVDTNHGARLPAGLWRKN